MVPTWPKPSGTVAQQQRPAEWVDCAGATTLATPTSASPNRNTTVHEHLRHPDGQVQLETLPRWPSTSAVTLRLHPGSTPGRTARPRSRKSSPPATAQPTAAYCERPAARKLATSLSSSTPTCRISVRVSLCQASVSLPVALASSFVLARLQ